MRSAAAVSQSRGPPFYCAVTIKKGARAPFPNPEAACQPLLARAARLPLGASVVVVVVVVVLLPAPVELLLAALPPFDDAAAFESFFMSASPAYAPANAKDRSPAASAIISFFICSPLMLSA
jgi:hypothetical protein